MYVDIVLNRNSPPAILLRREGCIEGGKNYKRTLANLSDWPAHKIATLRRLLRNEALVSADELFETSRTLLHWPVAWTIEAVRGTIRKLGLDTKVSTKRSRERNIVIAMIAEQ